jgi:molybdenum cofactor cytidylyltransferase
MKFGPVPLDDALGKILGHNIARPDGRRLIRKGKALNQEQLDALRAIGRTWVYVAELEPGDFDEDSAALSTAEAVIGSGLRLSGPAMGRVNLLATVAGVLRVDAQRLARINACEGVTIATRTSHTAVQPRQTVATIKIIPYAVAETVMREVEAIATEGGSLLRVDELAPQPVSLIFTGSLSIREKLARDFGPLTERVEALGSHIASTDYVSLDDEGAEVMLAETLSSRRAGGARLIILAGETTIMDRHDIVPRAVERAGGRVERLGAPVDPGNLFMLAYLGDTPVLGAPGCARSRKTNITDWALPRLLAGDRLTQADIVALGHGGLLEDAPDR